MKKAFNYLFNQIPYGFVLFPLAAILVLAVSCDVCHARVDQLYSVCYVLETPTPVPVP